MHTIKHCHHGTRTPKCGQCHGCGEPCLLWPPAAPLGTLARGAVLGSMWNRGRHNTATHKMNINCTYPHFQSDEFLLLTFELVVFAPAWSALRFGAEPAVDRLAANTVVSGGSAGRLVSTVKEFAAAGISNKVVALLDNDTAAHDAMRALRGVALPPNIKVLHYPKIEYLEQYPTKGPGGLQYLDVNGLAGSVELYLGKDTLLADDGELTPIHWTSYIETQKAYQGVVANKDKLHSKFDEKIRLAKQCSEMLKSQDWTGLEAILQSVFHAFE